MGRLIRLAVLAVLAAASVTFAAASATSKQPRMAFDSPVTGLALDRGSLWVSIAGDDVVLRLDARSGRRLARIDLPRADLRALGGGTLAAGRGKIWVAAPVHVEGDPSVGDASGWIGRIDTRTLALDLVQVHGDRPAAVAVGRTAVWITGVRTLRRVDLATGQIAKSVEFKRFLGAVAATRAAVWVTWGNTDRLMQVDPRTLDVRASIPIGHSSAGSSLAVAGKLVWAATDRGLVGVDAASAKITSRISLPGASQVAFDGSRLWALADGGVYSIRGKRVTKRLVLPTQVFGTLAAAGHDVWLSDEATNSLRRIPTS